MENVGKRKMPVPQVPLYFDIATNIYVYSQYDLPYTGK